MAIKIDDPQIRDKRYQSALLEREEKLIKLVEAYKFALPGRNKWVNKSFSFDKTNQRWDITAVEGLQTFASNLQSLLMPPFEKWMKLVPAKNLLNQDESQLQEVLDDLSDVIFQVIDQSNLALEANIAFQDMGISTGLIQIQRTGNPDRPIRFEAIPLHTVAFSEYQGKIENIWRTLKVPVRDIQSIWPDATLSDRLRLTLETDPDKEVDLVEGTIYYPDNPPDYRYFYYISDPEGNIDLDTKEMEVSPWLAFRFSVSPGEKWGFGPVLQCLDYIRIANKIAEMDIKNAGFAVSRPIMVQADSILNPYNVKMEPGAQIRVNDVSRPPIAPLDIAGNMQLDQLALQPIQQTIKDMLFADPLGPSTGTNQTATEVSIRQQNWIKKSTSSFARITSEFLQPLIAKTMWFLKKEGYPAFQNINFVGPDIDVKVNGQNIAIDFISPVAQVQNQQDAQAFMQYATEINNIVGPQGLLGILNFEKVPAYLANKQNIPAELVKSETDITNDIAQLQQAQQQAQQQQQPMQTMQTPQLSGEGSPDQTQIPNLNLIEG